jgi:putative oxidoreductase
VTTLAPTQRLHGGLALLRTGVGAIFIAHGAQKLFIYGIAGVTGAFGQMGVPFPGITGPLVALLEFFGGIALLVGLLTRLAGFFLAVDMLGAIFMVRLHGGFFLPSGMEFELALGLASMALALTGAGNFSLDYAVANRRSARR